MAYGYWKLGQAEREAVFHRGTDSAIDSYSVFFDNAHRKGTGLQESLRVRGVTEVTIAGLATDYCVKFTALDARQLGYKVRVVFEECRGVEGKAGDVARAVEAMRGAGADVG
jgi:nicotinamidase/pyrazinamidase